MEIKIKYYGYESFIQYIHQFLKSKGIDRDLFEIKSMFTDIFSKYDAYCNKQFRTFLEQVGFKKNLGLEIIFDVREDDLSSSFAHIDSEAVKSALKSNNPKCYVFIKLTPKIKEIINDHFNEFGDTAWFYTNVGVQLLEALVHEAIHIGQIVHNEELFLNKKTFKILSKFIEEDVDYLTRFMKKLYVVSFSNETFIKHTKLEGEASFFGLMYSFQINGLSRIVDGNRRVNFMRLFKSDTKIAFKQINIYIKYLNSLLKLMSLNYETQKSIEVLLSTYQKNTTNQRIKSKLERQLFEFERVTMNIKKDNVQDEQELLTYLIGRILMYVLASSKQHRYNLTPRKMFKLVIESNLYPQINPLRKKFEELLTLIDTVDNKIKTMEQILPKDKQKLIVFKNKMHSVLIS